MIYFRQILIMVFLLIPCSTLAFYPVAWEKVKSDEQYIAVDMPSINTHNDSIYYALKYCKDESDSDIDSCRVVIIQSKDNYAGVVQTYEKKEYEDILTRSTKDSHPAYIAEGAKTLKEIDASSTIFRADKHVKAYISYCKTNGIKTYSEYNLMKEKMITDMTKEKKAKSINENYSKKNSTNNWKNFPAIK